MYHSQWYYDTQFSHGIRINNITDHVIPPVEYPELFIVTDNLGTVYTQ